MTFAVAISTESDLHLDLVSASTELDAALQALEGLLGEPYSVESMSDLEERLDDADVKISVLMIRK